MNFNSIPDKTLKKHDAINIKSISSKDIFPLLYNVKIIVANAATIMIHILYSSYFELLSIYSYIALGLSQYDCPLKLPKIIVF